jgi:hypothetical protein
MNEHSLLKLGGVCAILLGISKIVSSGIYLILDANLRATVPAAKFLPAFADHPTLLLLFFWVELLVGVLGVAVVPAVASYLLKLHEGWVRWTSNLASAGFIISAVGYSLSIARLPNIAKAFVAGDVATKAVLAATWKSSIDLFGLWGYGAIGLWVLVVSLLSLRLSTFPVLLGWLGILHAILLLLVPVGDIFKVQMLLIVVALVGIVLGPIWWIWTGALLRRMAKAT